MPINRPLPSVFERPCLPERGAPPLLIAHRGACRRAPENTLAALDAAWRQGVRWVEVDVRLSTDGVPFLLHDATLERTTSGRGQAAAHAWDALRTLDAGSWFHPRFAGEPLPSLEATLRALRTRRMGVNLELKPHPGQESRLVGAVGMALARVPGVPVLFSSFSPPLLGALARHLPGLSRGLLVVAGTPVTLAIQQAQSNGCTTLHLPACDITVPTLRAAVRQGVRVVAWTVDDRQWAIRLARWGVTAVISNDPPRLMNRW